ncbi:MAG: trypsin-like peptidase domain-containing protein [Balneolaceae bacterium]|nr:trypsin-like peptidase domain-containing protein [Balneolaceae bacterium]
MIRTLIFGFVSLLFFSCTPEEQKTSSQPDSLQVENDSTIKVLPSNKEAKELQQPTQNGTPANTIEDTRSNAITNAVDKVSPAVVSITVTELVQGRPRIAYNQFFEPFLAPGREREYSSIGSGFIISEDGLIVTNEHVANKNATKVMVSLPDGNQYEAEILGTDELADLALLKLSADRDFPYVEFGNSDEIMVGEWSLAIGNPFGLFDTAKPSVTVGVVSALNRDFRPNPNEPRVYIDMIQTDAAINSGNSGGPLVNSEGEVIGVNTFIYTGGTSRGFVGLGFAIPSNRVQKIISQLSTEGEVKLSYDNGLAVTEMTPQLVRQYGLPPVPGMLVTGVNKDGPAFDAGVVPGDIILKIGDEAIQSPMHLQAILREYEVGDTMRLELFREGKRYEAKIKLRPKVESE